MKTSVALIASCMFVSVALAQPFQRCATHPENATVLVPSRISAQIGPTGEPLSDGDVIAFVTDQGLCVGQADWQDSAFHLAAAGRLRSGDIGYEPGDPLRMVVWDASEGAAYRAEAVTFADCASDLPCGDRGYYVPDGILTVTTIRATDSYEPQVQLRTTSLAEGVLLEWSLPEKSTGAGAASDVKVEHRAGEGEPWRVWPREKKSLAQRQALTIPAHKLRPGPHHFRLKLTDAVGKIWSSPVQTVHIDGPRAPTVSSAHPNPTGACAQVAVWVPEAQPVHAAVYNALGQRVRVVLDGELPAGKERLLRICSGSLAAGVYFVRVRGASFSATRRVVLVR